MRVGLMSFAHPHSLSYARALAVMPGVELLAADPDHATRAAGESGGRDLAVAVGVPYVDSYAELAAWQPDGVIICAENARHRELVELAASAGAHVLCEKPIATSLVDAQRMIDACRAAGVNLMIAYPVRFSAAFIGLKSGYDSGAVGAVAAVTGTNTGRLPTGERAWFVDRELAGGGSLMDHTVHVADLLDCLFSGVRAESVYAVTNRLLHADLVEVETGGLVSVTYSNGVVATIDCSWSKPSSYPTWGGLTVQLVGTNGIADMDAFGSRVDGHSDRTRNALWLPYGPSADEALVREFVGSISDGRRPQPDGETGYRTLEIVIAAYESVRTGQVVNLP